MYMAIAPVMQLDISCSCLAEALKIAEAPQECQEFMHNHLGCVTASCQPRGRWLPEVLGTVLRAVLHVDSLS